MEDARVRKPPTRQALDPLSGHPVPLAASAEHAEPQLFDLLATGFQPSPMQRHRMIRIMASLRLLRPQTDGYPPDR
jgi:hypothetical protein